jgi:hypothetical protein
LISIVNSPCEGAFLAVPVAFNKGNTGAAQSHFRRLAEGPP